MLRLATVLAALVLLTGCGPRRIDPPLLRYDSPRLASLSAEAHARDVAGTLYVVMDTHSMEPTLLGGDVIVVAPAPYELLRAGQIITYRAAWLPAASPPVTQLTGPNAKLVAAVDAGCLRRTKRHLVAGKRL